MTSTFAFESPLYLWLLALVPFLFIFDIVKLRLVKISVSRLDRFAVARAGMRGTFEFLPPLLRALALALLIIAVARPQIQNKHIQDESEGVDIVLTLDTSGSMIAEDMEIEGEQVNRLAAVKAVVKDFISKRRHDRIGMVIFGTEAYTQSPLTTDYDVLRNYLEMIEIGIVGEETAIGNAIATSVKRLKKSEAKSRVVILLTDGDNTAGQISPSRAAELARDAGIKVYTIAIGRNGPVPVPVQTPFGRRLQMMDMHVDTTLLQNVATLTGGNFYQASDVETLYKIYSTIDSLEKTKVIVTEFMEYQELFEPFVLGAAGLLFAAWFLQRTVFFRLC